MNPEEVFQWLLDYNSRMLDRQLESKQKARKRDRRE